MKKQLLKMMFALLGLALLIFIPTPMKLVHYILCIPLTILFVGELLKLINEVKRKKNE